MDKFGEGVSPLNVHMNGSAHLHNVWSGMSVTVQTPSGPRGMIVSTLDSGLVCFGSPTPFPVPLSAPDPTVGFSVNLFNNIWGTNYVMWYPYSPADSNSLYRFSLGFR